MEHEPTPTNITKCCGFLDSQGFTSKCPLPWFSKIQVFVPRELSFKGFHSSINIEYKKSHLIEAIEKKEKFGIDYQTRKIHGLLADAWHPEFAKDPLDFAADIKKIYDLNSSEGRPYFAIKNPLLIQVLSEKEIPFVNLDKLDKAPTLKKLDKEYEGPWVCQHHAFNESSLKLHTVRCSQRKSKYFWRWIGENYYDVPDCIG